MNEDIVPQSCDFAGELSTPNFVIHYYLMVKISCHNLMNEIARICDKRLLLENIEMLQSYDLLLL